MNRTISNRGRVLVVVMALLAAGIASSIGAAEPARPGAGTTALAGGAIGVAGPGVQPGYELRQMCGESRLLRWNGASYECASPVEEGGTAALTRLEQLQGLACGSGAEAGTLSLAINPLNRVVSLSCPRPGQHQLTAGVSGEGAIWTTPPDINCGAGLGDCSHAYPGGALVTLNESHDPDRAGFAGWGGACSGSQATCQVAMDQARLVTAVFHPVLTVTLDTSASARQFSCAFSICIYTDVFTDSRARVTVTDLDTAVVLGVCDATTALVVPSSQFAPISRTTTTCRFPVPPGHHLGLDVDDASILGGTQNFTQWADGPCMASTDPSCVPADPFVEPGSAGARFN